MWTVIVLEKAKKVFKRYPFVERKFKILVEDLIAKGPILPEWSHFGKLRNGSGLYHCHISNGKKGFPTLIALWIVINEEDKVMEVRDVITHGEFDNKY